jgi:hypothetical protein
LPCRVGPEEVTDAHSHEPLVLLRTEVDSRVYLACEVDAADRVLRWLELWIQDTKGIERSLPGFLSSVTNRSMDERWERMCRGFESLGSQGVIRTGYEFRSPPPSFLDPAASELIVPQTRAGKPWELCTDDAELDQNGRTKYSSSLDRFLRLSDSPTYFPAQVSGMDAHALAGQQAEAAGMTIPARSVPLNAACGRLMLRPLVPFQYGWFVDLLTGAPISSEHYITDPPGYSPAAMHLLTQAGGLGRKWMLSAECSRGGRIIEIFALKVRLFTQAVRAVRQFVETTGTPLFNLSDQSFRVSVDLDCAELPQMWTAKVSLCQPGTALRIHVGSTSQPYYVSVESQESRPGDSITQTLYSPNAADAIPSGRGNVRLDHRTNDPEGACFIATLHCDHWLPVASGDLAWIRLYFRGESLDLYGSVVAPPDAGANRPSVRVETFRQALPPHADAFLRNNGMDFPGTVFGFVPFRRTPVDLHSLGMLGIRTLLCGRASELAGMRNTLLDFMRSLPQPDPKQTIDAALEEAIRSAFERNQANCRERLGSHLLVSCELTEPKELIARVVPPSLWHKTIALLLRMFPAQGPYSLFQDLGGTGDLSLPHVFDDSLRSLEEISNSLRSLLLNEDRWNGEIRGIVRSAMRS